ncbi:MAG: DUF177 domain-containing protein [Ruminococcus sp.]|nr:DUF177 domain-containing protein [Ruminococcus sp.]
MLLQLKRIFDEPGQSAEIDTELTVSELEEQRPYETFAAPLTIKGTVKNRAGVVTLSMTVSAVMEHTCDRCLKAFEREYVHEFTHTLVKAFANGEDEEEGYEDYVVCPDNTLEIGELALTDLSLEIPSKILCKEDCKGLCPKCGKDLNEGGCGCE